ncbi:glycosyltransferase [Rhodobacter maris]|uniref:Glycosyltransferase involved in cell wall bisynthesis n=1 Tax=Rhodobacter maris TaxID=446682 RepID=A0A285TDW9_9RHOB|nr:glycosyltransferase [Rhodobacter maris]SOC20415.1 glycosyltransferase involved in cell wall bisynthesis [Rhodobacter maris]
MSTHETEKTPDRDGAADLRKRSRIAYIGYALEDGRAPHQAMGAIFLAANGHDVLFLATSSEPTPHWVQSLNDLAYVSFKGPRRRAGLSLIRRLFKELRTGTIDCVYVQGAQQALLCVWVPWIFPKAKVFYHTQDFKPFITWQYSMAEKMLSRRSSKVICNEINRAKVMQLVHGLPETPTVIRTSLPAPWPVPGREAKTRENVLAQIPEDVRGAAILIAAGGPYMSRRRSEELVRSLAHLDRRYCVVFTGMGVDNPLRSTCLTVAGEAGVRDRVVLLPRLGYAELLALYAACDIGALFYCDTDLANFYQGPGRVTEYLTAGIPFVTSDYPGLELLTLKYRVGEAARSTDPEDIARAIGLLGAPADESPAERAIRLSELAGTGLAYEQDARRVFAEDFSLTSPDAYLAHPVWRAIAEDQSRALGKT